MPKLGLSPAVEKGGLLNDEKNWILGARLEALEASRTELTNEVQSMEPEEISNWVRWDPDTLRDVLCMKME